MSPHILDGIKAISFDFWNTIGRYASEAEWIRQDAIRVDKFSRILNELGFKFSKDMIERTLSDVGAECEAERLRTELEVPSREVVTRFAKRLGIKKQIAGGLTSLLQAFDEALLEVNVIAEPGAIEVLGGLKGRGYPMVLLSNTSHGHIIRRIMDREGLSGYFDHLLFTDELGARKPNPLAFRIMLERLGTIAEETVHIGDRPELDILGAKRSHVRSILYAPAGECCLDGMPKPDFCISDLKQLIE